MGIGADGLPQILRHVKSLGVNGDTLLPLGSAYSVDISHKVEILRPPHKGVQLGIIRYIGHALLAGNGVFGNIYSVHQDPAGIKGQYPRHTFDGGGLSGSVMADKTVYLSGRNMQGQIIHCFFAPISLGQMLDFQHNCIPSSSLSSVFSFSMISKPKCKQILSAASSGESALLSNRR